VRANICQTPGCNGRPAAPGGTGTVCEPCVIRELDEKGFTYLGPFLGCNDPTPAIHRVCNQPAAPRLTALRQGKPSGCKTCRYAKAAASMRRPVAEVIAALDNVGLEYVGPYLTQNTLCPAVCQRCGERVRALLTNVLRRGDSCPRCGREKAAASRRIPPQLALAEIRGAGFTPVGEYVDANTRLEVLHDACGRPASVCLTDIRIDKAGCKRCALDAQGTRQRVPESVAIVEFAAAGYQLVGEYVDANTPVAVVHQRCRQGGRTSLSEIRGYGGACASCGRERTAAARRLPVEQVEERFAASGLRLLGNYTTGRAPVRAQCELCGRKVEIAPATVQGRLVGTLGCQSCSRAGVYTHRAFRDRPWLAKVPGMLYLVAFEDVDGTPFVKIGIGQVDRGRLDQHRRRSGRILRVLYGPLGECFETEQAVLRAYAAFQFKPNPGRVDGGGERECFHADAPIDLDRLWADRFTAAADQLTLPLGPVLEGVNR
jgi:hypothetical protein